MGVGHYTPSSEIPPRTLDLLARGVLRLVNLANALDTPSSEHADSPPTCLAIPPSRPISVPTGELAESAECVAHALPKLPADGGNS